MGADKSAENTPNARKVYLPKLSAQKYQAQKFDISLKKRLYWVSVVRGLSQSSCRLLHAVFICTQSLCMQSFAICLIFQWQFISLFFIASWHGYVPFWLKFACQMTVTYYFYFFLKKISLKSFFCNFWNHFAFCFRLSWCYCINSYESWCNLI